MPVPAQPIEEPAPQPVVSPLTQAAVFLVLTISPGGEDAVRDLLPDLSGLGRSVGFRIPEGALQVVTSIVSPLAAMVVSTTLAWYVPAGTMTVSVPAP